MSLPQRLIATTANACMRVGTDIGQDLPAALAFLTLSLCEDHADAIDIISDHEGIALSRRRITVSTSGVVPELKALGERTGLAAPDAGSRWPDIAVSIKNKLGDASWARRLYQQF